MNIIEVNMAEKFAVIILEKVVYPLWERICRCCCCISTIHHSRAPFSFMPLCLALWKFEQISTKCCPFPSSVSQESVGNQKKYNGSCAYCKETEAKRGQLCSHIWNLKGFNNFLRYKVWLPVYMVIYSEQWAKRQNASLGIYYIIVDWLTVTIKVAIVYQKQDSIWFIAKVNFIHHCAQTKRV